MKGTYIMDKTRKYNYHEYPKNDINVMNMYKNGEYNNANTNHYDMNTVEISSNILWIICGLMIVNFICLTIYCINNKWNKLNRLNKKQKGYKVVKDQSEDVHLV